MKKKVLIVVLLLIELCSIYLMYKSSNNKEVLDNKEIKEDKKEKFAIMVQDDTGKYNKSSDTTFPSTGYVLNVDMSECLDIEGNKIENAISGSNGSVTLKNKYTSYCTLYFDLMSLGKFCDGQTNMGSCITNKKSTIGKVENMTPSEVGGMYRYQGTDNVNNWICFGTTNKDQCTSGGDTYGDGIDKYMYRIIGVTPSGELALIKETAVKEDESTNKFRMNENYTPQDCGNNGEKCTWKNSILYNRLNGLCNNNNENCSGSPTGIFGFSNIFINSDYYEYLSNNIWLSKISDHEWKYGDTNDNDAKSFNGDTIYAIESKFSDSITAKIGLQYIHDYYYAYPDGNPSNSNNAKNSWIYYQNGRINNDWLLTYSGLYIGSFFGAWHINDGILEKIGLPAPEVVRPVFYLKSDIKISNTVGSKTDPFIITN